MHGWFAEGGIPNGTDTRITRLHEQCADITGLYRDQCASYNVGRVPTELGQLTALARLDLSHNNLTGECNQISLDCNRYTRLPPNHSRVLLACFSGRIPTELGQLTALTRLDLSLNNLTGGRDEHSLHCTS